MSASAANPQSVFVGDIECSDAAAAALLREHQAQFALPAQGCQPAHVWTLVKTNASRTVCRGQFDGQVIFLKHFHGRSLGHRLAALAGFSRARKEMRLSQYLRSAGFGAVEVIAAQCNAQGEWAASRAVAPATPADQWHREQLDRGPAGWRAIREATISLADLIGGMHRLGVSHGDLHCGNIMVKDCGAGILPATENTTRRQDACTTIELALMDLHRASRHRRLGRSARVANLAQLMHDRFEWTTRGDRMRFLIRYLAASRSTGTLHGWVAMIETAHWRHRRRQCAKDEQRIFRKNRYFSPISLPGGWRGHVALASREKPWGSSAGQMEFTPEQWREALHSALSLTAGDGVEIVKNSRSALVARRRLNVGGKELDVYIKRPRRKFAWKAIIDCFRPSRPMRAFALGHALLIRRIPTAVPLACLQRRVGPFLMDSILITETVDGPRLNEFLATWLSGAATSRAGLSAAEQHRVAQDVLGQMGRMLRRLHDDNMAHRDLKETNMIVRWAAPHAPQIVLLDLDGLTRYPRITMRRRFQGLMRLNVSLLMCPAVNHAGRLRMLLGYLRRPGSGRIAFKPYWRVLEEWSKKKINRQINSQRKRQKAAREK